MSYINILKIICVVIVMETVINGIVVVEGSEGKQLKCWDYVPKGDFEGYKRPLQRTAKQHRSIMGFRQSY